MSYIKNIGNRSTNGSYKFSVDTLDDVDLQELRKSIAKHNEEARTIARKYNRSDCNLLRVTIMGRGPRKHGKYNYQSYLPQRFAQYFDVYVNEDTQAKYFYRREYETGLSMSELRKLDKLESQVWQLKAIGNQRVAARV